MTDGLTRVPRTGRLGLGAASIGNLYRATDDEASHRTLTAAWGGGIRYFDTAPHYGLGLSERRLGAFLRDQPRDEFVVSTKVGRLLLPNPTPSGRDSEGFDVPDDLIREFDPTDGGIRCSLESSLERLGLEQVDIVYLHDPDAYDLERGLREGLPALIALRDEGLVDAVGVGVNSAAVAARAVREADIDVVMVAGRYSLLDQSAADDLLPLCVDRGVALVDAAVFNSGMLATPAPPDDATYDYAVAPPEVIRRARAIAQVCAAHGVPLPAAALQWPLRHPAVTTVVVGTARATSVEQNIGWMSMPIPDGLWSDLIDRGLLPADQPRPAR